MKQVASPNFDARADGIKLDYIVIHYTGMKNAAEALARLTDATAKVSAHYMIDEDGAVTQLVEEKNRAWHAGVSFWRGVTDINSASIGVELVNPGHEHGYRAFPQAQIAALKPLLREIVARHGLDARRCLLAHSDIAPARKEDPGELFPWQELAAEGLGVWPAPQNATEDAVALLKSIGYDTSDLPKALLAFQRRFYPENLTNEADSETLSRLQSIKQQIG